MLFHMVKKEFLVVKKYALLMLAVSALVPPFLLWGERARAGTVGFAISAIFTVFILLQYISVREYQYPKAAALLCLTPCPRRVLVLAKYAFCLGAYLACCLIFWAETLFLPALGGFSLGAAATLFLGISAFLGVYFPLQYKLGYEKTRLATTAVIVVSPMLTSALAKAGYGMSFNALPPALLCGGAVLLGAAILALSAAVSVAIYQKADL